MPSHPTPEHSAAAGAVSNQRLEQLRRELQKQKSATNMSAMLTTLIGVVALGVLGGYFYYGYTQITILSEPKSLVTLVEQQLSDNVSNVRQSLEAEVVKSSPVWAESLSKQALDNLPTARQRLEDYVITQLDEEIKKRELFTEAQFQTFLHKNHDVVERDIKHLATSPTLAESEIAGIQKALEAELQTNFQSQARDMFMALTLANEKIQKLTKGQGLTPGERLESRALGLGRRMLLDNGSAGGARETGAAPAPHRDRRAESRKPGDSTEIPKVSPAPADTPKAEPKPATPAGASETPKPADAAKPSDAPKETIKGDQPEPPKNAPKPADAPKAEAKPADAPKEATPKGDTPK